MKTKWMPLLVLMGCLPLLAWSHRRPHLKKEQEFGLHLIRGKKIVKVPFVMHSNLIIVPIQIDGSETLNFILDTGLGNILITDPQLARRLRFKSVRTIEIEGVGGGQTTKAGIAIGHSLRMGDMLGDQQNIVFFEHDALPLSDYVGMPIHGLIGFDLFNKFVVTIDFSSYEIVLQKPANYQYKEAHGQKLPLVIEHKKPYLKDVGLVMDAQELPVRVMVDTGAGHALMLDNQNGNFKLPSKVMKIQLGVGLSGEINGYLGRIQKVRFGNYELNNVVASFPEKKSFGEKIIHHDEAKQGNLGCELLRRFRVTFNYEEGYMVIKPDKQRMKEPFEHDMTGLQIRAFGDGLKTYYVEAVALDSPAQQAGLQEGDVLIAVNNQPAADLWLSDIYKMFQQKVGQLVDLTVNRKGKAVQVQLELKRLI
jgi:PDZ domain/Aspartyl protease